MNRVKLPIQREKAQSPMVKIEPQSPQIRTFFLPIQSERSPEDGGSDHLPDGKSGKSDAERDLGIQMQGGERAGVGCDVNRYKRNGGPPTEIVHEVGEVESEKRAPLCLVASVL